MLRNKIIFLTKFIKNIQMNQVNISKSLNFAAPQIESKWLTNISNYLVDQQTIVLNIGSSPAIIDQKPQKNLLPHQSTTLQNIRILTADSLVLFRIKILQSGWKLGYDLFGECLKDVPLWRSPQCEVGELELDPQQLCGQRNDAIQKKKFKVMVNLWFCTSETHCGIHNHSNDNFIEYHTQLYGQGRMQKFKEQKFESLYENLIVSAGNSHSVWCNFEEEHFVYPWHQYYADTDCIWSVVELHPLE